MVNPVTASLIGWACGKLGNSILKHLVSDTKLTKDVDKVVAKWAKSLPEGLYVEPKAIFPEVDTPTAETERPEYCALQAELKQNKLPSKKAWHAVFMESWRWVRDNVEETQSFFQLEELKASKELERLAEAVYNVCVQHEAVFKQAVIGMLVALGFKIDGLDEEIKETSKYFIDAKKDERERKEADRTIGKMYTMVQKLATDHGIEADIKYAHIKPIIDMPPLVANASERRETVSQILNELNDRTWIALKGTVGTGKTQLAILLAQHLGKCKAWICFSGKKNEALCDYFDRSIELIAGHTISQSGRSRFRIACEAMKSGHLIVLDDVPSLHKNQDLSTRLLLLLEECTCHGIKIISTGTITQPAGFCGSAGDRLRVLHVPPFTEGEINEVLQAYGASPTNAEKWSKFVNTLTLGHPVLIVAVARYLKSVAWQISYEQFDSLFVKQDYAKTVNPETIRRLLDTVEDPDCREFLYRLNLIVYSFTRDDAKAVAYIRPRVKRPYEKLALLDGLWIQRMSNDSYMISPLVQRLGSSDIPPKRQKVVNGVLGLRVLAKRHLNQWDAFSAVSYFIKAEAHQNAILVLLQALHAISEKGEISDDALLGLLWKDTTLPTNTDMGLRIFLRSFQLAVNRKLGRDVTFIVRDLWNLIDAAECKDCWPLFHATFEIIRYKEAYSDNWSLVHRVISKAITSFPEATLVDGTKIASISPIGPEGFIWLVVPNITTVDQLNDWICLLESLPAEALKKAFEIPEADQCCIEISHSVWIEEEKKDEGARQWRQVLDCFAKLANRARRLGLHFLWACANRAKMIIHAEYLDDLDTAQKIAEETMAGGAEDPRIQVLMKEYVGQQYYHERKHKAAQPWLEGAIEIDIDLNNFGRLRSLVYLSAIVGEEAPKRALGLVQEAVELAKKRTGIPELDVAKALSELAVVKWLLTNDVSVAFDSFDEAAERLFLCQKDDVFWKAQFVCLAHVAVYFDRLASRGEPPVVDGQPYDRPFRGMFFKGMEEKLAERFEEKRVWGPAWLPLRPLHQLAGTMSVLHIGQREVLIWPGPAANRMQLCS